MRPWLPTVTAALIGTSAVAGPVDDARYLHWTQQHEAAAAILEPWLADHPDDLAAHRAYLEVRVLGMGEGDVVRAEYGAWKPGDAELRAEVMASLDRIEDGELADPETDPFPPHMNRKWVKYLSRLWTNDPYALRQVAPILWGLDAPIGQEADQLRAFALELAAEGALSDDKVRVEAARAAADFGGDAALAVQALERLTQLDPKAWPRALDDDAQVKVLEAGRAVSREVALARLEKLKLPERAADAEQLRHTRRAELYAALGKRTESINALEQAWNADEDDPEAVLAFASARLATGEGLAAVRTAVRAGIDTTLFETWSADDAIDGLTWPDAYTLFHADRRVALGRLDQLRVQLDKATGAKSPDIPLPSGTADAAHHLEAAGERKDRIGIRHLVQAVRLARAAGNAELEAKATAELEARKAWFPGGLDARIAGWEGALGGPLDLRPVPSPRQPPSSVGQPLTDFQVQTKGGKLRASELTGLRVLASFSPSCAECADFLRDLDAVSREIDNDTAYLAVDVEGDAKALDAFLAKTDLKLTIGRAEGDLPEDFVAGGVPRVFVIGPDGSILRDTALAPNRAAIRLAIRDAMATSQLLIEVGDAPASVQQVKPQYPLSAHWLGTPEADCLGQVIVRPDGVPFHVNPEDCVEPFVTVTREALSQWRFEPRSGIAEALVVVGFKEPYIKYPGLPEASCLWWGRARQDGSLHDTFTNCERGAVRPQPVPWSEVQRTDTHVVQTAAGNMVIDNVDLPIACEVALDVANNTVSLAPDQGECTDVVIADVVERVRRWDWDVGLGRSTPVRVVLRFDVPPHLEKEPPKPPTAPE